MKSCITVLLALLVLGGCSREIDRCIDANFTIPIQSDEEFLFSSGFNRICVEESEAYLQVLEEIKKINSLDDFTGEQKRLLRNIARSTNENLVGVEEDCLRKARTEQRRFAKQKAKKICNSQGIY